MPAEDYFHPDGLLGWIARWSGDYTGDAQTPSSPSSSGYAGSGLLMRLAGNDTDNMDGTSYAPNNQAGYSLPTLTFTSPLYATDSHSLDDGSATGYPSSARSNTPIAIPELFSGDTILDRPVELMNDQSLQLSVHMGSDWVQHIAAKELSRRAAMRYLSDTPVRQTRDKGFDADNAADGEPPPLTDMQPAAKPPPADAGVLLSGDNEAGGVSEQMPDQTSSSDRNAAEPPTIAADKSEGTPADDSPIAQSETGSASDITGPDATDGATETEANKRTGESSKINSASLDLAPSSDEAPYSYSALDGEYGDKGASSIQRSEPNYIKDYATGWEPSGAITRRGDGWIRLANRYDADPAALALANARDGSIRLQKGQYVTFDGLDSVSDAGRAVVQRIWGDEAALARTTQDAGLNDALQTRTFSQDGLLSYAENGLGQAGKLAGGLDGMFDYPVNAIRQDVIRKEIAEWNSRSVPEFRPWDGGSGPTELQANAASVRSGTVQYQAATGIAQSGVIAADIALSPIDVGQNLTVGIYEINNGDYSRGFGHVATGLGTALGNGAIISPFITSSARTAIRGITSAERAAMGPSVNVAGIVNVDGARAFLEVDNVSAQIFRNLKGGKEKFNDIGRMVAPNDFPIFDQGGASICTACSIGNSLRRVGISTDMDAILSTIGSKNAVNIDKAVKVFNDFSIGKSLDVAAKADLFLTMDSLKQSVSNGLPAIVRVQDAGRDLSHAVMVDRFVKIGGLDAVKIIDSQIGSAYYETQQSFAQRFLLRTSQGNPVGYGIIFKTQ